MSVLSRIKQCKHVCNLKGSGSHIKINTISGEIIESPLTMENCITSRDSLAKEIYNRLFLWIVKKLNKTFDIDKIEDDTKYIGLLDIFGFECFQKENNSSFRNVGK